MYVCYSGLVHKTIPVDTAVGDVWYQSDEHNWFFYVAIDNWCYLCQAGVGR